jgi:hypothetical protein
MTRLRHILAATILVALLPLTAFGQAPAMRGPQAPSAQGPQALEALAKALEKPEEIISGQLLTFTLDLTVRAPLKDGKAYKFSLVRDGEHAFALSASDTPFGLLTIIRSDRTTALVDETHKRVFLGEGPLPAAEALEPGEFARRLVAAHGDLAVLAEAATQTPDSRLLALQLVGLLKLVEQPAARGQRVEPMPGERTLKLKSSEPLDGRVATITLVPEESRISSLDWTSPQGGGLALYSLITEAKMPAVPGEGYEKVAVDRADLERTLLRGWPRMLEIAYRRDHPRELRDTRRENSGGVLIVADGRRTCVLAGVPRERGTQHGKLLTKEARRAVDTVLYAIGLEQSLKSGQWFYGDLKKAWAAAAPGLPEEYKLELAALSEAGGIPLPELQLANLAADRLRDCRFAVGGKAPATKSEATAARSGQSPVPTTAATATTGTKEGLQDEAVVFVIKKPGSPDFTWVGHAGFIGGWQGSPEARP